MNFQDLFSYDQQTGILSWKAVRPGPKKANCAAGSLSHGYLRVSVNQKMIAVHRIVWEMARGPIGEGLEIDHIDGNRANNRLANLRLVCVVENLKNKSLQRNSSTGLLGVNPHGIGFKVTCSGRYVGWTKDFFDACCIRKSAERKANFHPNHGRSA